MKRLLLCIISTVLVLSLAAPAGAVFASEPPGERAVDETSAPDTLAAEAEVSAESTLSHEADTPSEPTEPTQSPEPPASEQALIPTKQATASKPVQLTATEADTAPVEVIAPADEPAVPPLAPQRDVYVYSFQTVQSLGYVELYNSDETDTQPVNGWRVVATFTDGTDCTVDLSGYIFPESKVLVAQPGALREVQYAHPFACSEGEDGDRVVRQLELYDGAQLVERIVPPNDQPEQTSWVRKSPTATYRTGEFAQDFEGGVDYGDADDDSDDVVYSPTDGYWYEPPPDPGITVLEVLVNPRDCVPSQEGPTCYDFVKLQNTSEQPVDLADYRLRSGYSNASPSSSNTAYFSLVLEEGDIRTLTHERSGERLSITANDGTVWFEDAEGVVSYPTKVPPYVGSDRTSNQGMSWAYDSQQDSWRWAIPSPLSTSNQFPPEAPPAEAEPAATLKPCDDDQFRNPETNRCKKIASGSTLKPCQEGQYRNPATNRCRSVAALSSSLQPCDDDQFRNPATNRCKKIASATSDLTPCGPGRERNPLTNRCRNIVASTPPAASFAVEPIAEPASVFIGWAVLGGIALLALGYAGWEWRGEIGQLLRRIPGIGRFVK